ncbi:hypothetical protein B566_EDAN003734 [Ephemera danica]|nr:hypothetical protein B566_EDAN003734 [Ephemera danica]
MKQKQFRILCLFGALQQCYMQIVSRTDRSPCHHQTPLRSPPSSPLSWLQQQGQLKQPQERLQPRQQQTLTGPESNKSGNYLAHLEELLDSVGLLELNICSCSDGQQVLEAVDDAVWCRGQGGVANGETQRGHTTHTLRELDSQVLRLDVQDERLKDGAGVIDHLHQETVREWRDVEHVEQCGLKHFEEEENNYCTLEILVGMERAWKKEVFSGPRPVFCAGMMTGQGAMAPARAGARTLFSKSLSLTSTRSPRSWVPLKMPANGLAHHRVLAHEDSTHASQTHTNLLHLLRAHIVGAHNEAFWIIVQKSLKYYKRNEIRPLIFTYVKMFDLMTVEYVAK